MPFALRYVWASPCTALGLCLASPAFLFGATARVVDGVIEIAFSPHKTPAVVRRALPFAAITFGHMVLGTSEKELDRLRTHERAHVRQYERWGILFFAAYPAASLWQWLAGRRPYMDNGFEVQAREEASE
ncbi:hypothetical protein [Ramlibacter sp. WS9]|uniref:hypothetical protein n=1 Tax=Ramlibacter sp. WS9 TaxID=1882741 RepID=UPI001144DD10|nr:hypothetical protein [Ramlibacter sp. WS9]ROZ61730.1 hypothetical protein EEB15_32175 [Ramlibacter sp. WS9]